MNPPAARLSSDERADLIRLLRESESQFLDLVSALTEEQWTREAQRGAQLAPPDKESIPQTESGAAPWSVQQIAEHLVLGEKAMLLKIAEALANPAPADWQGQDARKTHLITRALPDRSRKAQAPPLLTPHHNWTRDEAIAHFKAGRAKTLALAEETQEPLKEHCSRHPFPIFDMLDAYQWLLYIPLHNIRHNQQIAEALQELESCA